MHVQYARCFSRTSDGGDPVNEALRPCATVSPYYRRETSSRCQRSITLIPTCNYCHKMPGGQDCCLPFYGVADKAPEAQGGEGVVLGS